jgi:beta-lactamase superfamily II metal-dependent hydrolase
MKFIKKYLIWIGVSILLGAMVLCLYIYRWEYRKPALDVYFFSLNKGRAVFIRTPDNKTLLVGGGQNTEVIKEITKVTPFYKRKIDIIIIPSAVPAQIGGLLEVLSRYEISEVIMPKVLATSTVLDILIKEIHKQKIHVREVERGGEVNIGGIELNILFPYKDFKYNKTSLPELGMSISYSSTTVYLLGNLSKTIQKDIAKYIGTSTDKNIVEFYNTASDTKVSTELIKKINPEYIWSTKERTIHITI